MLLKLVELRSSDWGRVHAAAAASNATPDNDPNYFMVRFTCCTLFILLLVFSLILCLFLIVWLSCFSPQNEPTFYTEDGTPFTAADPGEHRRAHAHAGSEFDACTVQQHILDHMFSYLFFIVLLLSRHFILLCNIYMLRKITAASLIMISLCFLQITLKNTKRSWTGRTISMTLMVKMEMKCKYTIVTINDFPLDSQITILLDNLLKRLDLPARYMPINFCIIRTRLLYTSILLNAFKSVVYCTHTRTHSLTLSELN